MAKAHKLRNSRDSHSNGNLINLDSARKGPPLKKRVEIIPRNIKQEEYLSLLYDKNKRIIIAAGSAGSGKTMIAVSRAIEKYKTGEVNKLLITRPAVGVAGENHGFLPGTLNQKMEPWLLPIFDVFEEYYTKQEIANMMEIGTIEVAPLMYMRGRSFKNCCIIFDEAQNSTPEQMKMILTRLGEGTVIYVTGDLEQTDHKKINGLEDFCNRINTGSAAVGVCKFTDEHVERDPVVKEVLSLYRD